MKSNNKLIKKYSILDVKMKAMIWFVFCNAFQKGISYLCVPFYTRLLSSEQYGIYSLFQSWVSIATVFFTLNLFYSGYVAGLTRFESNEKEYTTSCVGFTLFLSFIGGFFLVVAKILVPSIILFSLKYILYLIIEIIFTSFYYFWAAHERYFYSYVDLLYVTLIPNILCSVLGIYIMSIIPYGLRLEVRIIINLTIWGITGLWSAVKLLGSRYKLCNKFYWIYSFKNNFPLIPHYLSGIVLNQADKIMIDYYCGSRFTAYYSLSYSISMMMLIFTTALKNALDPMIYKSIRDKSCDNMKNIISASFISVSFLTILSALASPELLRLFAPSEYYQAKDVFPSLASSVFFVFSYNIFSSTFFYYKRSKTMTMLSVVAATSNVLLNIIFIPMYGYVIAGYTTLISYIVLTLVYFFAGKCILHRESNELFYSHNGYLMVAFLTVLLCNLTIFVYDFLLLRWIIILSMLFAMFIFRNKIVYVTKELKNVKV